MRTRQHRKFAAESGGGGEGAPAGEGRQNEDKSARVYRVVIVEDEYLTALALEAALEKEPFVIVAIVDNGPAALRAVERDRPDFLIMDIQLSGNVDGIEAGRMIYERFGVRCLYASAYSDVRTRERAAAHAPLGWLSKPYSETQLIRELRRACARLDED